MKRNLKLIAGASAASLLVFAVVAQETLPTKTGGTEIARSGNVDNQLEVKLTTSSSK
jgi:hypothetical protein